MRVLLFLLFSSLTVFGTKDGPDESYFVVHDLSKEWHIYDQAQKVFIPFIGVGQEVQPAHTVFLDVNRYKDFSLLVRSSNQKGVLFINGVFFQDLIKNQWTVIPVSELPESENDLTLTLYGSFETLHKQVFIGAQVGGSQEALLAAGVKRSDLLIMKSRSAKPHNNSLVILFGSLLLFATYLSSVNPKAFGEYFSLEDLFITNIRDTKFLISKPLNQVNLTFVVFLGLSCGILYVLIASQGVFLFNNPFELHESKSTGTFLYVFVIVSLGGFGLFLFKYFFLSFTGKLFGLEKSVNIHYFKVIQFTLFFFIFSAICFYAVILKPTSLSPDYSAELFWIALLAYTMRTVLVYFSILKRTGIQSLYLFAYLCVVEILPILVGIRFAF